MKDLIEELKRDSAHLESIGYTLMARNVNSAVRRIEKLENQLVVCQEVDDELTDECYNIGIDAACDVVKSDYVKDLVRTANGEEIAPLVFNYIATTIESLKRDGKKGDAS